MKQFLLFLLGFSYLCLLKGQTPLDAPLPDKFNGLSLALEVNHFPATVHPVKENTSKPRFLWKHNTAVMCSTSSIEIIEFGAYLFYQNKWNLRASYDAKLFTKWFNCPKAKMEIGQPYTYHENWRISPQPTEGWALWYFIGEDESGKTVYGIGRIETTNKLLNQ